MAAWSTETAGHITARSGLLGSRMLDPRMTRRAEVGGGWNAWPRQLADALPVRKPGVMGICLSSSLLACVGTLCSRGHSLSWKKWMANGLPIDLSIIS